MLLSTWVMLDNTASVIYSWLSSHQPDDGNFSSGMTRHIKTIFTKSIFISTGFDQEEEVWPNTTTCTAADILWFPMQLDCICICWTRTVGGFESLKSLCLHRISYFLWEESKNGNIDWQRRKRDSANCFFNMIIWYLHDVFL